MCWIRLPLFLTTLGQSKHMYSAFSRSSLCCRMKVSACETAGTAGAVSGAEAAAGRGHYWKLYNTTAWSHNKRSENERVQYADQTFIVHRSVCMRNSLDGHLSLIQCTYLCIWTVLYIVQHSHRYDSKHVREYTLQFL